MLAFKNRFEYGSRGLFIYFLFFVGGGGGDIGNLIGLFFYNSNSNRLIYSWVLQSAQFSLF